jgi:hypothetical protein
MKSMLDVITLNAIYKILTEKSETKLSPAAQILYIRCLISHFKKLDCSQQNSVQFEMFEEEFPNYQKWKRQLQELHKAKLIYIGSISISFYNHWGSFIDREGYDKKTFEDVYSGFSIDKFIEEMTSNQPLFELCGMKFKTNNLQTRKLMDLFIKEQQATNQKYADENSCKKHFINWIPFNVEKVKTTSPGSGNKILGADE